MFNTHKTTIIVSILAALFFGVGGYAIGRSTTPSMPTAFTQGDRTGQFGSGMMNGSGIGTNRTRMPGGGFTSGAIIAKDDTSITVETRGGQTGTSGTKIIFLAASTQITKSTEGATTDLTIGKEVTVTGTTNADGSLTAKTVQLRPENMPGAQTNTPTK